MMVYNPELVKLILGDKIAELMDGTINIEKSNGIETKYGFVIGDKITFNFKNNDKPLRQFIVTGIK